MELYVNELLEQNELLMKTIIELEKEAKNRCVEMEKRLALSANRTEEVVLALNEYEMDIKKIINERISQIEASDIIDELNSHLMAVNVENNYLREQNDNLKHDLDNLIELMKRKMGDDSSQDTKTECLTFCDVDPEDIFGPIEAIISNGNGNAIDEEVQVEMKNDKTTNNDSSLNNKYILEEKELLISKLQEHLQTVTKELELKDEVVKNLEIKLNCTRKENLDIKLTLTELNIKFEECDSKLKEAVERISVLNDQKQSLMIQLDEESEQRIQFKEELSILNSKLEENMEIVSHQSTTIQHLREAIVNKCKFDSSQVNGISYSSQQNL